MILVNERRGYSVCLECHEELRETDARAWMSRHVDCQPVPAPVPAA